MAEKNFAPSSTLTRWASSPSRRAPIHSRSTPRRYPARPLNHPRKRRSARRPTRGFPRRPTMEQFNPLPHPEARVSLLSRRLAQFPRRDAARPRDRRPRHPVVSDDRQDVPAQQAAARRRQAGPGSATSSKRAGAKSLIDQNGRTLYYGIHANQAFADFVTANGLDHARRRAQRRSDAVFPRGHGRFPVGLARGRRERPDAEATTSSTTTTVPTPEPGHGRPQRHATDRRGQEPTSTRSR